MATNEERKSLAKSERLSSVQLLHSKIQCGLFRANGVVADKTIMMMGQFISSEGRSSSLLGICLA